MSATIDDPAAMPVPGLEAVSELVGSAVVDGVPVLLAGGEALVTGALVFRVGRADESLASSGITHLVEHLALYRQNLTDVHHNGQTSTTFTVFHATGSVDEVVSFLNGVCASLRDLPIARLTTEKDILRTEAARRDGGGGALHRLWRYGAQGPGLVAYDEVGLERCTGEDVEEWAAEWFVQENVVCFLTTGTLPEGLDLTLPQGRRHAVVPAAEVLPSKPAWFRGQRGGVVIDAVVERSTEAVLFARVAQRILFRELRQEGGLSYDVGCDYEPIDAERARITLFADALQDKEDAVVGALVDTLASMRAGRFPTADLDAARKLARQELETPHLGAAILPSVAMNLLLGAPVTVPAAIRAEQDAVTADDLARVARAVWDDALAQVPRAGLGWAGFAPAPGWSTEAVTGTPHGRIGDKQSRVIIGTDGVSTVQPEGVVTVRFDECALLQAVPDGGRTLTGLDGMRITVEPTLYWGLTRQIVERAIDRRVAPDRVVQLPARLPEDIPVPPEDSVRRGRDTIPTRTGKRWRLVKAIVTVALVVSGLVTLFGGATVYVAFQSLLQADPDMTWGLLATFAAVTVVMFGVSFALYRARQRVGTVVRRP